MITILVPLAFCVAVTVGTHCFDTWWIRRRYRRERSCPDPLHRAEAARSAAVDKVRAWMDTGVFVVVFGLIYAFVPSSLSGWARAVVAVSTVLTMLAGFIAARVWASRRRRVLGLTTSPCPREVAS